MSIKDNLSRVITELKKYNCTLVAVSKNHPASSVKEAYNEGQLDFGENKVQEMGEKAASLPTDIRWHLIGHLQRNKVKYIAPFVYLIHSVDSLKLLEEINKEGIKNKRIINCLLQIHIADEETKFGFSGEEANEMLRSEKLKSLQSIKITGLMGMATNTEDEDKIRSEFKGLKNLFDEWKKQIHLPNVEFSELSMGMSGDYKIALEEGSSLIRIGTAIFGNRNY